MSRALRLIFFAALPLLVACDRGQGSVAPPSTAQQRLDASIETRLGGTDTCVVIADTATGAVRYQYGRYDACARPLPPCSTFNIPNSLIGVDAGVATPATVYKWDGAPQPVSAWERDVDMTAAYRRSIPWWFQRLARQIGVERYRSRLKAFDYGSVTPAGKIDGFWLGPSAGGGLTITPRQQADFLHRFFAGRLAANPDSVAAVEAMMAPPDPGGVVASGGGSCPSSADKARQAGWWIGRVRAPDRDVVVVAAMEGEQALPGAELQDRMSAVLSEAGYLPGR